MIVKIGTSSLVGPSGDPDEGRLAMLCDEVAQLRDEGIQPIVVSSGAIAAGLQPLGLDTRPADIPGLQAAAAVGQGRLASHLLSPLRRTSHNRGAVAAHPL